MRTSARGVRHPQGVVIIALPWCGGRTRAPCSPSLVEGGPLPLPGGEDSGGPGCGLERPPGVGKEPACHLPPTPAPRPGVEARTAHTPPNPAAVRGSLPRVDTPRFLDRTPRVFPPHLDPKCYRNRLIRSQRVPDAWLPRGWHTGVTVLGAVSLSRWRRNTPPPGIRAQGRASAGTRPDTPPPGPGWWPQPAHTHTTPGSGRASDGAGLGPGDSSPD